MYYCVLVKFRHSNAIIFLSTNMGHFIIGHFTVTDGSEPDSDLVLVQTFLLYYVNQVILMLTSIFQGQFP